MKPHKPEEPVISNMVNEPQAVYATREELEDARLREAINRTDTEKFQFLMTLMKMNTHMSKAVIHHKKGF
ncbi:MAG: hypothetical protein QM726_24510 [Chitinophagaceae bacterium]